MPDGAAEHLTAALGGQPAEPQTDAERVERERVRNLVQSVAACYNSLLGQATDPARRSELAAHLAVHDDALRRLPAMPGEERRTVIETYPELLARLRAELDG